METGFYHLQLLNYIEKHHPELVLNLPRQELREYIDLKAKEASQTFEASRLAGMDVAGASEEAQNVLFSDLQFSLYDLVKEIISEEFADELPKIESGSDPQFLKSLLSHFSCLSPVLYDKQGNEKVAGARYRMIGELEMYLKKTA